MGLLMMLSEAVHGQSSRDVLVPLPSVLDFTGGEGWGLALGAGVEYEAAYDGSDEYEFEVDPAGALQYRKGDNLFFWEGLQLGWRGLPVDGLFVQTGIRYESGLEPDDSEDGKLDGLPKRDSHVAGFLEFRKEIGENWRNWIGGFVLGGESDFGFLGLLAAGHRFGPQNDGTGTEVFVFSTFGTDDFINKDFGVSAADESASGLPQTDLDGGYRSTGLTVIDRRWLTANIMLQVEAGVELYSSEIKDSPIAQDDYEAEIGASLVYSFF